VWGGKGAGWRLGLWVCGCGCGTGGGTLKRQLYLLAREALALEESALGGDGRWLDLGVRQERHGIGNLVLPGRRAGLGRCFNGGGSFWLGLVGRDRDRPRWLAVAVLHSGERPTRTQPLGSCCERSTSSLVPIHVAACKLIHRLPCGGRVILTSAERGACDWPSPPVVLSASRSWRT
jgi:hypothetical protein